LGSIVSFTQLSNPSQPPSYTRTSGNEDGFGSFNFVLDNVDGYQHSVATLQFTITKDSGTWANAADVLTPNASGFEGGVHVFVTTNGGATNTGFRGFSAEGSNVPEPLSLASVGFGLLTLGGFGVYRRRKSAV